MFALSKSVLSFLFALTLSILTIAPAVAELRQFGPFKVDTSRADVIVLDGEIEIGTGLDFRRALRAAPDAKLLSLNSNGGLVQIGLLIADEVFERKLATYVPPNASCYSACSFIFLAGIERRVEGKLGVHQISSLLGTQSSTQYSVSDIIDVLNRFGTPIEVLTIMFRTPAEDLHVFSADEIQKYKINRTTLSDVSAVQDETPPHQIGVEEASKTAPQRDFPNRGEISIIEDYARKPNRMVLYSGLDFAEQDVSSTAVDSATLCAMRCYEMNGACKAFTFNVKTHKSRGPNCFLKSGQGQLDGNDAAISGRFLSRGDPNPSSFTIGVIDPATNLYENVDLMGGDLSRRPFGKAKSARECRLACLDNDQCRAFTYVKTKKECWLKSTGGQPRAAANMLTGVKEYKTFSPATIIDLD